VTTWPGSLVQLQRFPVRSGDIVTIDFGVPVGSTPALTRPAVVVTADQTLQRFATTFHVVPLTTNVARAWSTDVALDDAGLMESTVAQCHLCTVVDAAQVTGHSAMNVGALHLAQIRSVLADLLDCP
jgi:mRNA-degrading endonuclease toxin of MazEF toxin-antitoxin module